MANLRGRSVCSSLPVSVTVLAVFTAKVAHAQVTRMGLRPGLSKGS